MPINAISANYANYTTYASKHPAVSMCWGSLLYISNIQLLGTQHFQVHNRNLCVDLTDYFARSLQYFHKNSSQLKGKLETVDWNRSSFRRTQCEHVERCHTVSDSRTWSSAWQTAASSEYGTVALSVWQWAHQRSLSTAVHCTETTLKQNLLERLQAKKELINSDYYNASLQT